MQSAESHALKKIPIFLPECSSDEREQSYKREQEGSEKEITLFIYLSGLISVVTGLLKKSLW